MATVTNVLDRARFESRARLVDLLALGLLAVLGASLMVDMYYLGATSVLAVVRGGELVYTRDARFVRMALQAAILMLAFGWASFRLLSLSARRVGG
jgi:hypothetical protein